MRHFLLVTLIIVITANNAVKAQLKTTYGVGIKGGLTASRFLESKVKNNYLTSYLIGLTIEQRFSERMSLSYDLTYSRQGNMMYISNPGLFNRVRTKYDYFTLPISLRYRLRRYPILLSPGIQVGYLVKNQNDFLPKNGKTYNNTTSLKKVDFGPFVGLGYRFSRHFFGEIKYYQSLQTLMKSYTGIDPRTGTPIALVPPELYNQVASASLTYYLFVN